MFVFFVGKVCSVYLVDVIRSKRLVRNWIRNIILIVLFKNNVCMLCL